MDDRNPLTSVWLLLLLLLRGEASPYRALEEGSLFLSFFLSFCRAILQPRKCRSYLAACQLETLETLFTALLSYTRFVSPRPRSFPSLLGSCADFRGCLPGINTHACVERFSSPGGLSVLAAFENDRWPTLIYIRNDIAELCGSVSIKGLSIHVWQ